MSTALPLESKLRDAAAWIHDAEALVIGAGAGMGVDSGLPDFRGDDGFWNAYPPFRKLGLSFIDLANPQWFDSDPALAWGFYGHRLNLYRRTQPHAGFDILRRWAAEKPAGAFVFTSNVDGQFQRAGFDDSRIVECHGSIHRLQPCDDRTNRIWDAGGVQVTIDDTTMRATGRLPQDPVTGRLARPNILMFGDFGWNSSTTETQWTRYEEWLKSIRGKRIVVIECGAGTAVPSVRKNSDSLVSSLGARLVRINVREPEVPPAQIGLACGALDALTAIESICTQ